jgi:tRNA pseudouridine55 synthase
VPDGDLELPTGPLRQRPPAYSAVKLGGRRAYALARSGEPQLELPERQVEVYRFDELWRSADRRGFAIECSSGTYVRSLIADLGDAYCEQLRRTAIGPFAVEDADADHLVSLDEALSFLPARRLDPGHARLALHGAAVPAGQSTSEGGVVRLDDDEGLIAIAERRGELLKPVVVLRPQ